MMSQHSLPLTQHVTVSEHARVGCRFCLAITDHAADALIAARTDQPDHDKATAHG